MPTLARTRQAAYPRLLPAGGTGRLWRRRPDALGTFPRKLAAFARSGFSPSDRNLIDAYADGLVEKSEFEPRLRDARERLERLQADAKEQADQEAQEHELRLVVGRLQEFADQVRDGLQKADWHTRREIIRAVVKRIEVEAETVRVVYRISPGSMNGNVDRESLQGCWRRQ